jgi:hypothetical protein
VLNGSCERLPLFCPKPAGCEQVPTPPVELGQVVEREGEAVGEPGTHGVVQEPDLLVVLREDAPLRRRPRPHLFEHHAGLEELGREQRDGVAVVDTREVGVGDSSAALTGQPTDGSRRRTRSPTHGLTVGHAVVEVRVDRLELARVAREKLE